MPDDNDKETNPLKKMKTKKDVGFKGIFANMKPSQNTGEETPENPLLTLINKAKNNTRSRSAVATL